ncbi:MAG: diacylglycerol kinase [Sulfuricella sp.]
MKNQPLYRRFRFAWQGLVAAFLHEASFRTQVLAAVVAIGAMLLIRPPLVWVTLVSIMIGLILAAELFNTALEHALDGLHPEQAPFVRMAKDCAAASVMVLSVCSVIVFLLMLAEVWA